MPSAQDPEHAEDPRPGPPVAPSPEHAQGSGASAGIPDAPPADPGAGAEEADSGDWTPLPELPRSDFWDALYQRRSIRRFKPDPVPRELVDQVMHAGIWAPSSCNYQMWDLVAVDDPEVNADLAALSLQMGNAPVNIVVSYGRDFSEENQANVQSASALIQNMSLAAQVLGLGTFWITQTGDAEKVRERVGLPRDRRVIAVLAVGFPKTLPKKGPKRRPLSQVSHWNHYAGRAIPSSVEPEDWEPDLLALYQRARVLNGLRHNKPRAWEVRALDTALEHFFPDGASAQGKPRESLPRWLDVLPCTGIVTERLTRRRPGFRFDIAERSAEVASFVAGRVKPRGEAYAWPSPGPDFEAPPAAAYDVVSCFYRFEDLSAAERAQLAQSMLSWLAPGGRALIGFVSRRSFHDVSERLRRRRGGPGGVEYVLSPDPNIGPFRALVPGDFEAELRAAGFAIEERLGLQAAPQPEEVDFRARNFSPRSRGLAHGLGRMLGWLERLPTVQPRLGRFQYLLLRRGQER